MKEDKNRVFPAEKAGKLQSGWRRFLQNPMRILKPYVKEGMVVLDFGCGPGFFTVEAAKLAGINGKVIAVDIQQAMLDKLSEAVKDNEIRQRIILRKSEPSSIGVKEQVDIALAFHVVHEVPDAKAFMNEPKTIVKPGGIFYLIEPKFRVSAEGFKKTVELAEQAGFTKFAGPWLLLSRAAIFKNG